jgi:hypothetical protein
LAITAFPARYYKIFQQLHEISIVPNPAGNYKIRLAAAKIGVLKLTVLICKGMILPAGTSASPLIWPKREEEIRKGAAIKCLVSLFFVKGV